MNWRNHITWDPEICHGQACVKGTRALVSVILDNLAAGRSIEQILKSYPTVTKDDLLATIAYAADLSREHVIPLTHGAA